MYMTETLKELMCVTQANVPADNPSSNQKSCGYFQLAFQIWGQYDLDELLMLSWEVIAVLQYSTGEASSGIRST